MYSTYCDHAPLLEHENGAIEVHLFIPFVLRLLTLDPYDYGLIVRSTNFEAYAYL